MTSKRLHPAARLVTYFLLWLFAFPVSLPAQDLAKLTVAYSSRSIAPASVSRIFDFTLQDQVNAELGLR